MMLHDKRLRVFLLASALLGVAVAAPPVAHAATFVIINNDGAGEGFNDPTAAAPVGGNSGTTIGAQRLIAFQAAADIWGARLTSSVTIRVRAQFDPLSCTATSAVLGSAGPITVSRDFTGALVANTYYAAALANALHGSDLDAGDDINATFSSTIGTPGCLTTSGWYYGLDSSPPGNLIDFVTVLLHELGHGLGFLSLVDLASGAKFNGFNDTYMRNLENHGASPADYPSMSNAQRVAASIATGNLHWTGANVRAASGVLSAGAVGDHVRMFAPNPQQGGSSVSHFDTALTPNQLMEPSYTTPLHTPVLELPLFQDIGWTLLGGGGGGPPGGPVACTFQSPLGDFNGDGRKDLLFRRTDGLTDIFFMNGLQIQSGAVIGSIGLEWTIVGEADFNGDGKADILLRRNSDGMLFLYLMNGTQILAGNFIGAIGNEWKVAGIGDFNADGRADMLFRRTSDGMLALYLMNGFQIVAGQIIGSIGTEWATAGIADFNGDGRVDMLFRRTSDGMLAGYLMNGFQITSGAIIGSVGTEWKIVAAADFSGDGKADFLARRADGSLALYLMNGLTLAAAQIIGSVGTEWSFVGAGDLNADARADIVFRGTNGSILAYLMNGFQILSGQIVGSLGAEWDSCYGQGG